MEEYSFRLADEQDRQAIIDFMRKHWGGRHPLVELPELFDYYYAVPGGALRFALAFCGDAPAALAGYLPASGREAPDVWVSIWVADPAAQGAGLALMDALPQLLGCRTLACNNIRPETQPFYSFLGYHTGRVPHYYRLARSCRDKIVRVRDHDMPLVYGDAWLEKLESPEALERSGFECPPEANPYKDNAYIIKRYFYFPDVDWRYRVYAVRLPQQATPAGLLVTRLAAARTEAGEQLGTALRLVDYIGPAEALGRAGTAIEKMLHRCGAEYADMYCVGIPEKTLRRAGLVPRPGDGTEVVPHYLDPLVRENVEYYYFTSNPEGFTLFRADGDQDRPHVVLR